MKCFYFFIKKTLQDGDLEFINLVKNGAKI